MSRTITISDTIVNDIVSYDSSDYAWYSTSNIENGYNGSDNTSYAQINLTRNANAVTYIYYIFGSFSEIPSGATINSVSCTCKCSINNTTASRVATREARLYSGTTAMGTAYTVANSTTAFSITPGTWTRAELQNARLRLYAVRGTSNTTSSYYFRFYGATLTVSYTYSGTAYTITASSTAQGVTVVPASQELLAGETAKVSVSDNTGIVVTDNGNDVTSQLVQEHEVAELVLNPTTCSETTFANDSSYPASNGCDDTESTTYARFKLATPTQHAIYSFGTISIPSGATILSVECDVHAYISSTSSSITTKSVQLYAGSTAKGSATTVPTTNSIFAIADTGSWTASEVQNICLRFDGYYPNSSSYYLYVYGADLTITYQSAGYVYVYTMTSLAADHTILVALAKVIPFRVKSNGAWATPTKVLVKDGGTWKDAQKILVKDNGTWKS